MELEEAIEASIARGLEFVLAAQDADGSWTDWALPPGPSRDWTTADVGLRLAGLGDRYWSATAGPVERAVRWLLSRRSESGGWGYNAAVEPDADSTARALLLLAATSHACTPEAIAFLDRHRLPDGGFATFLPDPLAGSWGVSHPETTPVALLALRASPAGLSEATLTRGLQWIRDARRADGLWDSFWWSTPLVATEVSLALLATLGVAEPPPRVLESWSPGDGLETALLLVITASSTPSTRLDALARGLVDQQADDGSWSSAPSLRVTSRTSLRPWDDPAPGELFADVRRIHGTAVAVAALSRATSALTIR